MRCGHRWHMGRASLDCAAYLWWRSGIRTMTQSRTNRELAKLKHVATLRLPRARDGKDEGNRIRIVGRGHDLRRAHRHRHLDAERVQDHGSISDQSLGFPKHGVQRSSGFLSAGEVRKQHRPSDAASNCQSDVALHCDPRNDEGLPGRNLSIRVQTICSVFGSMPANLPLPSILGRRSCRCGHERLSRPRVSWARAMTRRATPRRPAP